MADLTPITRKETFLAKAGGQEVTTPAPITRTEQFLQAIIDNGGGGGTGVLAVTVDPTTLACDKTAKEIYDAFFSSIVMLYYEKDEGQGILATYSAQITTAISNGTMYSFQYGSPSGTFPYGGFTNLGMAATEYPVLAE